MYQFITCDFVLNYVVTLSLSTTSLHVMNAHGFFFLIRVTLYAAIADMIEYLLKRIQFH